MSYTFKFFEGGRVTEGVIESNLRDRDLELAFLRDAISRRSAPTHSTPKQRRVCSTSTIKPNQKEANALKAFFSSLTLEQKLKIKKAGILR